MKETYTKLPARRATRDRFEAIRRAKSWTLTTTVEKAAEALAEREQVKLPAPITSRRRRSA